ncbi:hypothetical protein BDC45DRAFT_530144 [Circinella umbellata]|nr:hypothetical protein BDC45DRAFT_530144 [Circinella umbellata]
MLAINRSLLRLKSDESVTSINTQMKNESYDSTHLIGSRLIYVLSMIWTMMNSMLILELCITRKIRFPTLITDLETVTSTSCMLMTMIIQMERHEQIIKNTNTELENRRRSMGKNNNQLDNSLPAHSFSDSMRPTWYSPPRRGMMLVAHESQEDYLALVIASMTIKKKQPQQQRFLVVITQAIFVCVPVDIDEYGFYNQNGVWRNAEIYYFIYWKTTLICACGHVVTSLRYIGS